MSQANFSQIGPSDKPSPSIWANCPRGLLNDLGLGIYAHEDFIGGATTTSPSAATTVGKGLLSFSGDADTELAFVADHRYGALRIETDTTAGDAGALVSRVFGRIVKNSGQKLWFEARVAPGDVDDDMGTFIGIVEEDGANLDLINDDPATNTSTSDNSFIGFFQNNADPNAYNILHKKAGSTTVEVLADATASTQIDADDRASLTDGVFHKLGFFFDGRDLVKFYVNGYHVASLTVDSAVEQSQDLAAIVAVKTGDAAAEHLDVDWVRFAFQERG